MVPESRLGMRDYSDIKEHAFFSDIDFGAIQTRSAKVPPCEIMNLTIDSDDSTPKQEITVLKRKLTADYSHYFDECCRNRARHLTKKYWEGEVKLRRKLFLQKRRYMLLFEDGILLLLRRGHIKQEFDLTDRLV